MVAQQSLPTPQLLHLPVVLERYLKQEGINFAGGSLGGERARRIQFWPISGRVRQMALAKDEANVFETERRTKPAAPVDSGALELF
jgi:chemotaxis protein CheD